MRTIVLATGNAHKVREIGEILAPLGIEVEPQNKYAVPEADETGTTFIENAIIKARNAAKHTGHAALADDSGIEVDALNGTPGVYSSRFSGAGATDEKNLQKLIDMMKDVPESLRTARYHCVMVYMRHADDPAPLVCHATWEGVIAIERKGTNGFGYDPVFYIPSLGKTAAELSPEDKNDISHRGKALRMLTESFTKQNNG